MSYPISMHRTTFELKMWNFRKVVFNVTFEGDSASKFYMIQNSKTQPGIEDNPLWTSDENLRHFHNTADFNGVFGQYDDQFYVGCLPNAG
jgi:hypothetical protein